MEKIIRIKSCPKCDFCKIDRDHTEDSFEMCMSWFCKKSNKFIRRYVDWSDNDQFIPDWCELDDYQPGNNSCS